MEELIRDGIYTPDFPPRSGDSIIIDTDSGPSDFTVYQIRDRTLCEESPDMGSREFWFEDLRQLRWHVLSREAIYGLMARDLGISPAPVKLAKGIWEIGRKRLPGRDASKVIFIEKGVPATTLELVIERDSFNAFCLLNAGSPLEYGWHSEKTLVGGTIEVREGCFASDVFEDLSASQPESGVETRVDLESSPPRLWIQGKEFKLPMSSEGLPTNGCRYLAHLFDHPGQTLSCWELELAIDPKRQEMIGRPVWTDDVLDAQGLHEFKQLLKSKQAELAEAEEDVSSLPAEVDRLREEVADLREQSGKLLNKSGGSRQIAEGDRGKARQRVRKALDVVIAKVRDQDAAIGEDLDHSLGKGGVIFFRPPQEWGL